MVAAEFNLSETVFVLPPAKTHGAKLITADHAATDF
jgi:predicted PhzF superfamily epimerase YddE/YHI9